MWPWAGQVPALLVKFTGFVDVLAAIGLVLPALLRIQTKLTPIAAIGVMVLMAVAGVFHIARGEASVIGVNLGFAAIAAFVAWGRMTKAPISAK
jgi:DoxX-like family